MSLGGPRDCLHRHGFGRPHADGWCLIVQPSGGQARRPRITDDSGPRTLLRSAFLDGRFHDLSESVVKLVREVQELRPLLRPHPGYEKPLAKRLQPGEVTLECARTNRGAHGLPERGAQASADEPPPFSAIWRPDVLTAAFERRSPLRLRYSSRVILPMWVSS